MSKISGNSEVFCEKHNVILVNNVYECYCSKCEHMVIRKKIEVNNVNEENKDSDIVYKNIHENCLNEIDILKEKIREIEDKLGY